MTPPRVTSVPILVHGEQLSLVNHDVYPGTDADFPPTDPSSDESGYRLVERVEANRSDLVPVARSLGSELEDLAKQYRNGPTGHPEPLVDLHPLDAEIGTTSMSRCWVDQIPDEKVRMADFPLAVVKKPEPPSVPREGWLAGRPQEFSQWRVAEPLNPHERSSEEQQAALPSCDRAQADCAPHRRERARPQAGPLRQVGRCRPSTVSP